MVAITRYTLPLVGAQQVNITVPFPPGTEFQGVVAAPTVQNTGPFQANVKIGTQGGLAVIVCNGTVTDHGFGGAQEDIHWVGKLGPFEYQSFVVLNAQGVTGQTTAGLNLYIYYKRPGEGD